MRISVIGTGYVGLVAGACLADAGNDVLCADKNKETIRLLRENRSPIFEPGLERLLARNAREPASAPGAGGMRIEFTTEISRAARFGDLVFICVGTPPKADGAPDLSDLEAVAHAIGENLDRYKIIVNKSTVPVGAGDRVESILAAHTDQEFDVVSVPEFLKVGSAVADFSSPDRVVVGIAPNARRPAYIRQTFDELYAAFLRLNNRIIFMDRRSAELTKYAANVMLAGRLSLMNELSRIAEQVGADIESVRVGIGSDSRIGFKFLFPGPGFGGSCFPKDLRALIRTARDCGIEPLMLEATLRRNEAQKSWPIETLRTFYGRALADKTVAVWGLAFKARTDDVRESSAIVLIRQLLGLGAKVRAYDPAAMDNARKLLGDAVVWAEHEYGAVAGADCLVVMTDWAEFRSPSFARLAQELSDKLVVDARNLYRLERIGDSGLTYVSLARRTVEGPPPAPAAGTVRRGNSP